MKQQQIIHHRDRGLSIQNQIPGSKFQDQSLFSQDNNTQSISKHNFGVYKHEPISLYQSCAITTICWIVQALIGAGLIGTAASNFGINFQYSKICSDLQICTISFTINQSLASDLFLYAKISPFYQNNHYFKSSYKQYQINGRNSAGTNDCYSYNKLSDFGVNKTVGGYLKDPNSAAFPCGFAMTNIFNDSFAIIDIYGNVLDTNSQITDQFYKKNQFIRSNNFLLSQWLDVEDPHFMNYFTIGSLPLKSILVLRIPQSLITIGNYTVVIFNNFNPNIKNLKKQLFISSSNSLGDNNLTLGWSLLIFSLIIFAGQVYLCFKSKVSKKI